MNLINWLGVGTVASTKQTNTKEIMVHMPKDSPTADGRTLAQVETKQEEAVNGNGEPIKVTTMIGNTKPAKWNSMGEPNRLTAPDVREGSQVSLYQVGGQSSIYWTTHGFSAETHRLETIVWGFQANPNTDENTEFNVENFYTITLDTRSGFFALRTSQSNGEKSGLEAKIDGMNGRFEMVGSNKSAMIMDDHNSKFTYTNKEGTVIGVDKKKLALMTNDSILLGAENKISLITKELNIEAKTINIKADEANIAIKTTNWEGNIIQEGNINQEGNLQQTGNTTVTGIVQGLTAVRTSRVDLDLHGHTGVRGGSDTSGPPVPGL